MYTKNLQEMSFEDDIEIFSILRHRGKIINGFRKFSITMPITILRHLRFVRMRCQCVWFSMVVYRGFAKTPYYQLLRNDLWWLGSTTSTDWGVSCSVLSVPDCASSSDINTQQRWRNSFCYCNFAKVVKRIRNDLFKSKTRWYRRRY